MAAVAMEDKKKEMIEKTAQQFQQLNEDNKSWDGGKTAGRGLRHGTPAVRRPRGKQDRNI